MSAKQLDMIVIGSGPAGQKAAVQAAKSGRTVALIEKTKVLGGMCVHRGTIPSKTLRENALRVKNMRENAKLANFELREDLELATLITRLNEVLQAHGEKSLLESKHIIIATGSHPRTPPNIPVDHEHLLDSDSILSMMYLPKSLTVLGGGVIASEYASIFQALGVKVTMIDKYPRPLGFLDDDLTETFVKVFEQMGGTWIGESPVKRAYWNEVDAVVTECEDGTTVSSEKLLCAAGRIANVPCPTQFPQVFIPYQNCLPSV